MTYDSDNDDNSRVWKNQKTDSQRDDTKAGRPIVDQNTLLLRREIVAGLYARGLSYGDIAKRILSDPDLRFMLEGYRTPLYRVVETDLRFHKKAFHKQMVDGVVADGALQEYVSRQDAIFAECWKQIEKGELAAAQLEIMLNKAQEAAVNKARALGVNVEGEGAAGPKGDGDTFNQQNLMFADASQFMKFMKQVKEAEAVGAGATDRGVVDSTAVTIS